MKNMMKHQSPIFSRAFDLTVATGKLVERFPRSRRAVLGRRLEEKALDFHQTLSMAAKMNDISHLKKADMELAEYNFALRVAQALGLMSIGLYGEISQISAECGRLLGGWIKKSRSQPD